jgi:hypothetical protein
MNRRLVFLLAALAVLFVIAGIVSMAITWNKVKKWEPITAQVVSNEVVRFQTRSGTMHRPEIEVVYRVHEMRYRIPISFPVSFATFDEARDYMRRYGLRTNQTILFNTEDPNDILLDIDPQRFLIVPAVTMGVGVLLLILCVVLFMRLARRICPRCAVTVARGQFFCYSCGYRLPIRVQQFEQVG